jgi:HK97 family phage portal protein
MSLFAPARTQRSNQAFDEPFWKDLISLGASRSGRSVTLASSLEVMAVLGCVRVISEDVAQVPLKLFRKRSDGGSDIETEHPLADLLDVGPNDFQTSFDFIENLTIQAALGGNFYSFKNKVRGDLKEIIPFPPGTVREDWKNFVPTYWCSMQNGEQKDFPAEAIWHVRGPSIDTKTGMAAIHQAREAIGLAMAAEDAHAKLHANGVQTTGIYSVDATLSPEQYLQLSNWIARQLSGENRFKPFVLDRGATFSPSGMSGVDAEHVATRKHQVEEICRALRVMPIMIGQADKAATYASAEQMFIAHVKYTLQPWFRRIEKSIDKYLLSREDRKRGIYAKFLPNALMRGSAKDRAEFYYKMWQMGTLNPNEIRAMEEQNPYKGGEIYRVPLNMGDSNTPIEEAVKV